MTLAEHKRMVWVILSVALTFLIIGGIFHLLEMKELKVLCMALFAISFLSMVIFSIFNYKCPRCKRHPGRDFNRFCTHCGQEIADETKLG